MMVTLLVAFLDVQPGIPLHHQLHLFQFQCHLVDSQSHHGYMYPHD